MKSEAPAPIPIPLAQRWHDARSRWLPVIVFSATICAIGVLWKNHVAAPTLVGQAEPVLANVSCHKPGVLAELDVARFQRVKAGDRVGQVMVADPRVMASSLAVIQAEIEALRVNLEPVVAQQRNAMNYDQLRLDWMRQRAQLGGMQVSLQLAETELRRTEELFKDKIVSQRMYDEAKAKHERSRRETEELGRLVTDGEQHIKALQPTNTADLSIVSDNSLRAEIAVQESKLRLAEAELSPIILRAPMDGIVATILHRSGEAVTAGQPIIAIATLTPVRIVGYLRPPILDEPKVGMEVEIRTRGINREAGKASIVEVGTQLESLPASLLGPAKLAGIEMGLPIDISLPPNLKIRPGELVDITLKPVRN